jgi:hypothetical protein
MTLSILQHLRQFTRPVAGDTLNYYSGPMKSAMTRTKYIGHSQEPKTPFIFSESTVDILNKI